MNDAIALLREYSLRDFEATIALYTERDEGEFRRKVRAVEGCLSAGDDVHSGFGRPRDLDDEWFEDGEEMREQVVPRKIFKVERHEHPVRGALYRAWLSGHFDYSQGAYGLVADLAGTEAGLRIVAIHTHCLSCRGRGEIGGVSCGACGGRGWERNSGRRVDELGNLVEILELEEPAGR